MALFLAVVIKNNAVPNPGETANGSLYLGDHADEAATADAAADAFALGTDDRVWVSPATGFSSYVTTTTTTRDVAPG